MGEKIVSIITMTITIFVITLSIAIITEDRKLDASRTIIHDFTEAIQYNGYVTEDMYTTVINKLPYNGVNLQLTHIKTITEGSINDITDIQFPWNIRAVLSSSKIYKMEVGDQIKVDLVVSDETMLDSMKFFLFRKTDGAYKTVASECSVILNEKY